MTEAVTYLGGWVAQEMQNSGGVEALMQAPTWEHLLLQLKKLFADGTDVALEERDKFTTALYQGGQPLQKYNSQVMSSVRQFANEPGYDMGVMDMIHYYRAGLSNKNLFEKVAVNPATNKPWTGETAVEALGNCMAEALNLEQHQNELYGPQKKGDLFHRFRSGASGGDKGAAGGSGGQGGSGSGGGKGGQGGGRPGGGHPGGKRGNGNQGGPDKKKWKGAQNQGQQQGGDQNRPTGPRCFACQGWGHKAADCPNNKSQGNGGAGAGGAAGGPNHQGKKK